MPEDHNFNYDIFFSDSMHTLKNMITPISIYTEMLLSGRVSEEKSPEIIKKISVCSESVLKVCTDLMNIFRIRGNLMELSKTKVNVYEILRDYSYLVENNCHQKNIEIVNDVDKNINIFIDSEMMVSAFMNLLNNAIKFSSEGSKITLSAKVINQDYCEIYISDKGVGIDEEKVNDKLQLGNYYSTKGVAGEIGTGLGLLIVKSAVERNGGSIRAYNNEDVGATFAMKLPLYKEE